MHTPRKYFPWAKHPSAKECADDLSAPNVDIARTQSRHVVPSTERVGRDIRAQCAESERKRREESGSAVVPVVDEPERVPENLIVKGDARTCNGNADKAG